MKKVSLTLLWLVFSLPAFTQEGKAAVKVEAGKPREVAKPATENTSEALSEDNTFEKFLEREIDKIELTPIREEPSWLWQLVKTTFVLGILLVIFYFIYRIYTFKKSLPTRQTSVLKLHYEYPLAQGKSLQIIELGNRLLVVGISESGINLLTEITDRAVIEKIILDCEKDNLREKTDFLLELSKVISRKVGDLFKKQKGTQFSADTWVTWRSSTKSRLEKLKEERDKLREKE